MSLGATTSAPASTWLTAVRASSSSVSSFVDLAVAQHAAVAVARVLAEADVGDRASGRAPRRAAPAAPAARSRRSSQAPEPSSSFSSGMPKRSTARTPSDCELGAPRARARRRSAARSRRARRPGGRRPRPGRRRAASRRRRATGAVSRTSARSVSVRRRRRRRVTGKPVIAGKGTSAGSVAAADRARLVGSISTSAGSGVAVLPWVELDPLARRTPRSRGPRPSSAAPAAHPAMPVQLAAREQPEDDEQRVEAKRVRHHVRHDDVALDLVDEDEEREHPERRERVRRRARRSPAGPPTSQGPMYGITSITAVQTPKSSA